MPKGKTIDSARFDTHQDNVVLHLALLSENLVPEEP
jgi:hypothetical protein